MVSHIMFPSAHDVDTIVVTTSSPSMTVVEYPTDALSVVTCVVFVAVGVPVHFDIFRLVLDCYGPGAWCKRARNPRNTLPEAESSRNDRTKQEKADKTQRAAPRAR